jgi:hypothetical protein
MFYPRRRRPVNGYINRCLFWFIYRSTIKTPELRRFLRQRP